MFSRAALVGIDFYQRHVSPRKGYRCAYSVHHGGTGCSGYAKHAIRDHGLWRAIPLVHQRFRDCATAYAQMRREDDGMSEVERREDARNRRRNRRNSCCDAGCYGLEGCALIPSLCRGGSAAKTAAQSKSCDVNPCDGDVGCGSCEVDVCSCG
ncbi:membrane protein insertion efficiency factor YidD [Jannaschia marina]|uniref:membrane protein insertion efficiency factor YidD n=1 Tax=Jannaschia marina TaxID=2741674 RepID=UPI0015CA3D99|nr:membrane protein insertion efficiency factor YidD [Jannaschia marina]